MALHNIQSRLSKICKSFMVLSANVENFNIIASCKTFTLLQSAPDHVSTLDLEQHFRLSNCWGAIKCTACSKRYPNNNFWHELQNAGWCSCFLQRHHKGNRVVLSPYISIKLQFSKNSSTKSDIHKEAHPPTYEGDLGSNSIWHYVIHLQN